MNIDTLQTECLNILEDLDSETIHNILDGKMTLDKQGGDEGKDDDILTAGELPLPLLILM